MPILSKENVAHTTFPISLKRVWQIADEMLIFHGFPRNQEPVQLLKVRGGRGEDPEAGWKTVLNFFLHGNNNE